MPSLKDIKRRIKSVKNTRQITKAMKMVSAAKLKKAQDEITAARPYAEKMLDLISSLASKTSSDHPLLASTGGNRIGIILYTSDRGLCGGFNSQLLRTTERFMREQNGANISLYLIGKRGMEYFKKRGLPIIKSRPMGGRRPEYSTAVEIAEDVINSFVKGELDEVHIIFSQFKSALTQTPAVQKLLPISTPKAEGKEEAGTGEYLYEPTEGAVLASLLPKYVEVQAFRGLLETSASEHGARMTAMDSASKNAGEMISSLTLVYNRLRQAAITRELMEIIGGAEALKG